LADFTITASRFRFSGTHIDRELLRRPLSSVFEREMAGPHVLGGHECRSVPLPANSAAIKNRESVGDGSTDYEILLDQQYRQA
jgi:hypothetical protein